MPALLTHIDRYEIKCLIGRGGMGELYLARDTNPNTARLVALKLLNTSLDSAELRDRFSREARTLAALNHPNIVDIYDSGEFEQSPYIVMEYVRGETLAEKIKRRAPLSLAEKLKLMSELCAGLAHAHDLGVIHRDIKPANLMVDPEGRLKILDFGIARVTEGSLTRLQLTQLNVRIGTPGYMSPEQIEGLDIDARSDLFAVGAVCYELLSYHEAFTGSTTRQIEDKVLQAQPVPLRSLVSDLHPEIEAEIEEIVYRALEKDRERRYQDASTMAEDFERQRLRFRSTATPVPAGRPTPKPGVKVRGSRADAAYQRALAVFHEGAAEAARRYVIEALAEDPDHPGANALLARLEPTPWQTLPGRTLPQRFARTVPAPSDSGGRTRPASRKGTTPYDPASEAETILKPRRSAPGQPLRKRYTWVALALALVVLAAGGVLLALLLTGRFATAGETLTIDKPAGGTITAAGIRCGSIGNDCSGSFTRQETVELEVLPDRGFVFGGYTGDCAPAGRTTMSAARRCGATFDRVPESPPPTPSVRRRLTIVQPKGGTILTEGIKCGTLGSDCSEEFPDGTQVTLHTLADKGFSSTPRYTGQCAPRGETRMTADRTCGATFQPSPVAATPPAGVPAAPRPAPPVQTPVPTSPVVVSPPPAQPETRDPVPAPPSEPREHMPPPPVKTPEEFAKEQIPRTFRQYCDAFETLSLDAIRRVYPNAPENLRSQLREYNGVECTVTGEPEYLDLDPSHGKARVEVGVRFVFDRKVGGVQKPVEMTAVAQLSRPEVRSLWHIDSLVYKPKR